MIWKSPKRVLHVLEATLGGTRRYVEDLATASNDGSYVNAIAYGTARADAAFHTLLETMHAHDWQSFDIDIRRRVDVRDDFACVAQLREIIASFRPDIIHGHSSKGGAIARLAVAGRRQRPAIVYSPNAVAVDLGVQYRIAEHVLAPFTDVFAAISASERDELIGLHLGSPESVRVVSPTVDRKHFAPRDRASARAALGIGDGPLVIGIGRLAPQKDPLGFVSIIAAARVRHPNIRGIWVGDGELRVEMEAAIAEAGLLDAIRITGWLTDVRPYIAACDVFVSCAAYESFGYVTAEALAMERPVVASRIKGTIDIVTTDVERAFFTPRDFTAAARLISDFVREPGLARDVAIRGRQSVLSAFSPETTRAELAETYQAALDRDARGTAFAGAVALRQPAADATDR
jgi:glycosyltransferase involved in cell wall biosynthesis